MALVIVEGPDGSGKSTLIESLKASFKWAGVFVSAGPKSFEDQAARYKVLCNLPEQELFLSDRSFLYGEEVYPKIFNRDPKWSVERLRKMRLDCRHLVIYTRLEDDAYLTDRMVDGKSHKSAEHMDQVRKSTGILLDAYDDMMVDALVSGVSVIKYDWENNPLRELIEDINNWRNFHYGQSIT